MPHSYIRRSSSLVIAVCVTMIFSLIPSIPPAYGASLVSQSAPADPLEKPVHDTAPTDDDRLVPDGERDEKLGRGWQGNDDVAWSVVGDSDGLHVLRARMAEGYEWRQIASLGAAGMETDRWIGNACMTSGGRLLAVVYAPRQFTNDAALFLRGGYGALVNVESGEVTQLGAGYSLAYFNPGCGAADRVALSQFTEGATKVRVVSVSDPESGESREYAGQVTSIVPTVDDLVGALGGSVVRLGAEGRMSTVVEARGAAFDLVVTAEGGLAYVQHDGRNAQAMLVKSIEDSDEEPVEVASAKLDAIGLGRDAVGNVYVTGTPENVSRELPDGVRVAAGIRPRSSFSSEGKLAIEETASPGAQLGAASPSAQTAPAVSIEGTVRETGAKVDFRISPDDLLTATDGESVEVAPEGRGELGIGRTAGLVVSASATNPVDEGASCAVARNDPAIQALQPRPAEVEWAVNKGVRQTLHPSFPLPALNGGGRVPVQVMLGILAQESNFWQASKYVVPGVTGNPLVGNFYGVDRGSSAPDAWWQIDYPAADCGYGIAQITDGMRVGGMPYAQQRAIAVDYQANIARGLQILIDKWNQTRSAGLVINNGDPQYLENWFYALWAYNTGFHPQGAAGQPWGVGWVNNPINQIYPANRMPFLDTSPADAANPQNWPYAEKVLGFAAHSVQFLDSVAQGPLGDSFTYNAAFTPGWWAASDGSGGTLNRLAVKPPLALFCNASNDCNPTATAAPCTRADYECWFHQPATWKTDCASECGHEFLKYSLSDAKPAAASSYPANCATNGLPSGALIVDNVASGTPPIRPGCSRVTTTGSFQFTFAGNSSNSYPSKVDLHQLGSGFNGQFYFTHTRVPGTPSAFGGALDISGTWTLGQNLSGWARVYVHMPNHGAWLQQANYAVNTGLKTVTRSVNQQNYANEWVSLGALQFAGNPSITLSNHGMKYEKNTLRDALSGSDDVAWDAVAFVPLAQKPSDFVVALGDSYSSGEGTSAADGSGFFRGSDHHGTAVRNSAGVYERSPQRNACHRSVNAWPYGIDLPGVPGGDPVRTLVQANDPRVDFQMLACAGAEIKNVVKSDTPGYEQQYGESTQLDRGFLDENTTLVTMSIGGNDVGFGPILNACIMDVVVKTQPNCGAITAPSDIYSGTLAQMADNRLAGLSARVTSTLNQVHAAAPNARVVLLGYPTLFDSDASCVSIDNRNRPWLNSIAARLNSALTKGAYDAGSFVTYQSPQYLFSGKTLCTGGTGINGLVFQLTPGDVPQFDYTGPGPNFGLGVSAQSIHPNTVGSAIYSAVANAAIRSTRVSLAASLVGGAATTYYSTFRLHTDGPASLNVTNFSTCGQEIRFGLRRNDAASTGVVGQQHTDSLSWKQPQGMQSFTWTGSSPNTTSLPSGWYALNGRLTTACSGGAAQPWQAELYW